MVRAVLRTVIMGKRCSLKELEMLSGSLPTPILNTKRSGGVLLTVQIFR